QRHQFGVLAHGLIDHMQKAPAVQRFDVLPQIPVRHRYVRNGGSRAKDGTMQEARMLPARKLVGGRGGTPAWCTKLSSGQTTIDKRGIRARAPWAVAGWANNRRY